MAESAAYCLLSEVHDVLQAPPRHTLNTNWYIVSELTRRRTLNVAQMRRICTLFPAEAAQTTNNTTYSRICYTITLFVYFWT